MNKQKIGTFGKFALENLTTGMYSDPKIIYREYIQNSTDAIDAAIRNGLYNSRDFGEINITIDKEKRTVIIFDNGIGIKKEQSFKILTDVGSSIKKHDLDRGFRGIGRLGGTTYVESLIFTTSFAGEDKKSIITWDCKTLKKLLKPGNHNNLNSTEVIEKVVSYKEEEENKDIHYFKVELVNIDLHQSELLDEPIIRSYLSQVAPIPFNALDFPFYHDSQIGIKTHLLDIDKPLEEYNIYINNDPNPIYKPYKSFIRAGKGDSEKRDDIKVIEYIKEYDLNGDILFWGWYAITGFLGYVKDDRVAGLRVRKNNILIGDIKTLDDFFTQSRFNKWFIGEIYVYDPNILPNGRRDDFEKDEHYYSFRKKLLKYTSGILSKLPPHFSALNSATKKIEKKEHEFDTILNKIENGLSSEIERKKLHKQRDEIVKDLESCKKDLKKAKEKIKTKSNIPIDEYLGRAETLSNKAKQMENDIIDAGYELNKNKALSGYSKEVKKVIIKIFEVIDINLDNVQAKVLENKIIESLKNQKK